MSDITERLRREWWQVSDVDCKTAADEIERLRARLALHDPCNGRMTGEPPRYAPECVVLRAELQAIRKQCADDDIRTLTMTELDALRAEVAGLREALLQVAGMAEALKKDCGMDPESPQAVRNGQYMNISYAARAALAARKGTTPTTPPPSPSPRS